MQSKGYVYFEKRENCWYARVTLTDEKGKRRNLRKKARDKAAAEEKLRVLIRDANGQVFGITSNVRNSFASACEIAGIKHGGIDGLTLHSLGHTAATGLVQSGINPQSAGRPPGHSQPQTTYRYLSADLETAKQAVISVEARHEKNGDTLGNEIARKLQQAIWKTDEVM